MTIEDGWLCRAKRTSPVSEKVLATDYDRWRRFETMMKEIQELEYFDSFLPHEMATPPDSASLSGT